MSPSLDFEKVESLLEELENAAYGLEQERMLQLLEELRAHSCNGISLKELFAPVKRKVEQSDCISAVELAMRLKNNLKGREE